LLRGHVEVGFLWYINCILNGKSRPIEVFHTWQAEGCTGHISFDCSNHCRGPPSLTRASHRSAISQWAYRYTYCL